MKRLIILFLFFNLFSQSLQAVEKFIEIQNGKSFFIDYTKADHNKETFVFINGLIYQTERWKEIKESLVEQGFGVLSYEFEGQNRTFVRNMDKTDGTPNWLREGMSVKTNSRHLLQILRKLKVDTKVNIVALSYGASIGASFTYNYPNRVNNLIFMSPLIVPLDTYHPYGATFRAWLNTLDLMGPIGSYWSNYYYNLIHKWYYRSLPHSSGNDYGKWKDHAYLSIFHQVKAINDFDLRDYDFSPGIHLHLITASQEKSEYLNDQNKMWQLWNNQTKGSFIHLLGAGHAIPDTSSKALSHILLGIGNNDDTYFQGNSYIGKFEKRSLSLK